MTRINVGPLFFGLVLFFLGFFYIPAQDFDLHRYYEFYDRFDERLDFIVSLKDVVEYNLDFIYFLTFMLLKQLGWSANLANGLYVSLYYTSLIKLISSYGLGVSRRKVLMAMMFSVLSVPIIYSLSISRTVAALSFFFIALRFDFKKNYSLCFLMFAIALFTHIGMVLYMAPVYLVLKSSPYLRWTKAFGFIYVTLMVLALTSMSWINQALGVVSGIGFFESYSRYLVYLEQTTSIFDDLSYYDVAPILVFFVFGVYMFLRLDRQTPYTITAGFLLLVLGLFLNSSTMFAQRTVMVIAPFFGFLFLEFVRQAKSEICGISKVGFVSVVAVLSVYAINLFGYRSFLAESF